MYTLSISVIGGQVIFCHSFVRHCICSALLFIKLKEGSQIAFIISYNFSCKMPILAISEIPNIYDVFDR